MGDGFGAIRDIKLIAGEKLNRCAGVEYYNG